jgi:hypothetical protein
MTSPIIERLALLERALAEHKWPAMSPWWVDTFGSFYESDRKQLVIRAGRRAGKSSSLCRVAVVEALYGEHIIPPGDQGVVGIVSVSRDEAGQRLKTIKEILDVLGVKYRPAGEGAIELEHKRITFKVFSASISGVVGGTWVLGICDELARWRDADSGANPATQVLASLRPTMATQPNAKLFLSSSPLGTSDAHADAFAKGDTQRQATAYCPTWIGNPFVSESETHELEEDDELWKREYQAIPVEGSEQSIFSSAILLSCTRKHSPVLPPESNSRYAAAIDPGTRGNAFTLAIASEDNGNSRIALLREWRGRKSAPLDPGVVLREIASILGPYGLREAWTDGYGTDFIKALARQYGLHLREETQSAARKVETFESLRSRFARRAIEIPDDPQLRTDLLGVRKWVTRNGLSIELAKTPDGRHCDLASAVSLVVGKATSVARSSTNFYDYPPAKSRVLTDFGGGRGGGGHDGGAYGGL